MCQPYIESATALSDMYIYVEEHPLLSDLFHLFMFIYRLCGLRVVFLIDPSRTFFYVVSFIRSCDLCNAHVV